MNKIYIQKFEEWWKTRRHTRAKLKGVELSKKTLESYIQILKKFPDIVIDKNTNIDKTVYFIREWLLENSGKGKLFKNIYPQIIFAIRTYLKMYEDDLDLKINRIAREIRKEIKSPVYRDIKGTHELFEEKFLSKKQIRDIILNLDNNLPHNFSKEKAKLFFQLLYDTGCRISELSNIKKKDVDFTDNDNIIRIKGKGGYKRNVNFQKSTLEILKNRYEDISDEDNIFELNTITLKIYFKKIINYIFENDISWKHIIKKVSPHWFRHSRATHLAIVWKGDMIRIQSYMGWSDIKMAEIYIRNRTTLPSKIQNYKSEDLWED